MDVTYARLCFQYVGALALLQGGVDVADFSPERLADPRLHAIAQRIELAADGNPDPNALAPQTVTAELADGRTLRIEVPHTLGSPQRPLSREQHLAKFRRCLSCAAQPLTEEAAERLVHLVDWPGRIEQHRRTRRPYPIPGTLNTGKVLISGRHSKRAALSGHPANRSPLHLRDLSWSATLALRPSLRAALQKNQRLGGLFWPRVDLQRQAIPPPHPNPLPPGERREIFRLKADLKLGAIPRCPDPNPPGHSERRVGSAKAAHNLRNAVGRL